MKFSRASQQVIHPDAPGSPAISVRALTRIYDVPGRKDAQVVALDGVDADLPQGSFTAVVGPRDRVSRRCCTPWRDWTSPPAARSASWAR